MGTYDVREKAINAYIENILLLLPIHGENTFDNLKASLFCKADYDKLNKYLGILAPDPLSSMSRKGWIFDNTRFSNYRVAPGDRIRRPEQPNWKRG